MRRQGSERKSRVWNERQNVGAREREGDDMYGRVRNLCTREKQVDLPKFASLSPLGTSPSPVGEPGHPGDWVSDEERTLNE